MGYVCMRNGSKNAARVLLKARPTRAQLDDRLAVRALLRSLDGDFFNIGRASADDREVVRRVTAIGAAIGAAAAVIHCIAPVVDPIMLQGPAREEALTHALEFLR